MAIEISAEDVSSAEEFLATLLEENIEDGKFNEGSALRDLAIKGLAFISAYMRKENASIRAVQSLQSITQIATNEDPDQDRAVRLATDALLSNWFISRKTGSFARGILKVRVSRRQDYVIPATQRFVYNRNLAFFLDVDTSTTTEVIVPASDLQAEVTPSGDVSYYIMTLRLVAARTGKAYEVPPGEWSNPGTFSSFILGASNVETFSGAEGVESTSAMIDRAESAISVRNLINSRSIDATLRERFTDVKRLTVVGMGDPEMIRDLVDMGPADLKTHIGGHTDIYVEMPVAERTFEGELGGEFTRPDGKINVFKDSGVADWTTTNVQVGDLIRLTAGLDDVPKDFIIQNITPSALWVSENRPFSEATEEEGTNVTYHIYRALFGPDTQIYPTTGSSTTGITSRNIAISGSIILPGNPVYDIKDVAVIDPDAGDPYINGADGFVHFPVRSNEDPALTIEPDLLDYRVTTDTPGTAQSDAQLMELRIPAAYDGKTVRVTYETLSGYTTVASYVNDRLQRVTANNSLVKGFHPAYLSFNVQYKLKPTASSDIDIEGLRRSLVTFINDFSSKDIIDASDIIKHVRDYSSNIGSVPPLTVNYTLILPDGNIAEFTTDESVEITTEKLTADSADALDSALNLGLTDNVIRYRTTLDRVQVENIG